jgi:hypothetical protein
MITILGIAFPVDNKKLTPPQTEIIQSYTSAIEKGKKEAFKLLKI